MVIALGGHLVGGLLIVLVGCEHRAHHVAQVGLELLGSRNPCVLASPVGGTATKPHNS